MKMNKYNLLAVAVSTALLSGAVQAESGTDVLKDGWEVHGYLSSNLRSVDGASVDTEFSKNNYQTAGTHGKSTNQVEFTIKKHTEIANGAWSDFVVRTEYGNGNSLAYSSAGSLKTDTKAQLEVKEAYLEIGGLPYLGEDTSIWAGQRYLNRASGLLSGEFWKQSSGVGAGIQSKIVGNTAGFAVVTADPKPVAATAGDYDERKTLTSYDLYYYGVDAGIGSLNFDLKYIRQANTNDNDDTGFGAAITLNTSYYGLDGWAQTAITYGDGAGEHRSNFGDWAGGHDDSESIFFTSYGVWNISDNWQLGTELAYLEGLDKLFGADNVKRYLVAARPSYKVNDNLRLEGTVSYGHEELDAPAAWNLSKAGSDSDTLNLELAAAFTLNADYFGRPQIKPYVSYIKVDDVDSAERLGIKDGDESEMIVGVHSEIWF